MKKLKVFSFLLVAFISSFLFVNKALALFTSVPEAKTNTFTIKNTGNYIVYYRQMDVDGNYGDPILTESDEVLLNTEVTPEVYPYDHFISPLPQTVVIDGYQLFEINYYYEREQFYLNIENDEYVSGTPEGRYYYDKPISLIAASQDSQGREFAKWSDGATNPTYSFNMTEDVTLRPIYGDPFEITFNANGGSPTPAPILRYEGEALGTLPEVTYDDCELSEGSYDERNCTYAYKFLGWYLEPTFETQVNEEYVPTDDTTLYAKWTKIYFHDDEEVFSGNNYIDTGIKLFSEENADKDFVVTFTVDQNNGYATDRGTIFTDMNERAEPYPGVHFFYQSNKYTMNVNVLGHKVKDSNTGYVTGQSVTIIRESGKILYSYDNGPFIEINDLSSFNQYFNNNATFGAGLNSSGNPYRYFKGTLSDMTVALVETKSYTVHFNANGGTGMMLDQIFGLHGSQPLSTNTYEKVGYVFSHWTTNADGTGTRYEDEEIVGMLANDGEEITLYAQWVDAPHYYVAFDANNGEGTMSNQEFVVGVYQHLSPSQFTKTGYIFDSWNTASDGSGTRYEEGQEVRNLCTTEGCVVTLYAQYGKTEYHYDGEITFDGIDDYIDTQVNVFSGVNIDKDFDIQFTIVEIGPALNPIIDNQTTIMNAKDETHTPDANKRVPGFVTRFDWENTDTIHFTSHWEGNTNRDYTVSSMNVPVQVLYKRRNGVVTVEYTYNNTTYVKDVFNQNLAPLDSYSPLNVVIGASQDSDKNYCRFFNGKLADIRVEVYD